MENLDLVHQKSSNSKARHIPGPLSVVADKLSWLDQTTQTEWSLLQEVFQAICNRWHRPQIDLFAMRFNNKCALVCVTGTGSPGHSSGCAQSAMVGSGSIHFPTIYQPYWANRSCCRTLGWPIMPWFWDPVALSSQIPLSLPNLPNLLTAIQSDPSQKSDKS